MMPISSGNEPKSMNEVFLHSQILHLGFLDISWLCILTLQKSCLVIFVYFYLYFFFSSSLDAEEAEVILSSLDGPDPH